MALRLPGAILDRDKPRPRQPQLHKRRPRRVRVGRVRVDKAQGDKAHLLHRAPEGKARLGPGRPLRIRTAFHPSSSSLTLLR